MKVITWLQDHRNFLFLVVLVLLWVALAGPWETSSDGVPPAEWCARPNHLTDDGRCVRLVSGWNMLSFFGFAFLPALLSGQVAGSGTEIMAGFLLILPLVLPVLGILLRLVKENIWRDKIMQPVFWLLAVLPSVWFAVKDTQESQILLWGIWFFLFVAAMSLLLEFMVFQSPKSKGI